ncbi:hypothetical protein RN001_008476 [Aquatica leii]|uniref:Uncharacterized protein n=1 Tax=Aquatica leii TaxID=1421715 RepID=A0AAN7P4A4_9COLE|nr:hypothetical protein RN001_008476 [Aquatica leii]
MCFKFLSCTSTPSTSKTDKGDINGDAQSGFSTSTLTKSSSESKGFCDQVLDYLITIRTQNRQILKLLTTNTQNNSTKAFELPDDLELTLPVSNLIDLRRLEEYLSNNTNLSAVINVQKKEYCCISEPVEEEVRGDLELDDVPLAQRLEMLKNRTSNEDEDLLDDMPLIQRLQLEKKILKIDCK